MTESEIKQIYAGFEKKDMTFEDFRKKVKELTSPKNMQQDLQAVMIRRSLKL